jgi:hypothetical protein
MLDLIMLVLVIVCFALATAYARLCDDLLSPPTGAPSPGKSSAS